MFFSDTTSGSWYCLKQEQEGFWEITALEALISMRKEEKASFPPEVENSRLSKKAIGLLK